jgi:hypothetical protein
MKSEAKKIFRHGFNLTEQELRRIHAVSLEQINKLPNAGTINESYEIKFKNGVVAEPQNLNEIFTCENIGTSQIVRILLSLENSINNETSQIKIEFFDIEGEGGTENESLKYIVSSNDRDWVFVTSSLIEERIQRLRKLSIFRPLASVASKKTQKLFSVLALPILLMIMMLFLTTFMISPQRIQDQRLGQIQEIENQWKEGKITDSVQVFFELEKKKAKDIEVETFTSRMYLFLLFPIVLFILNFLVARILAYYFPIYNFLWGDFQTNYEKNLRIGYAIYSFIVIVLGVGLFLEVFGSYLSNLILPR